MSRRDDLLRRLRGTQGRGRKLRGLLVLLRPYRTRVVLMFVALSVATSKFLTTTNVLNVARQISLLAIVACGMTYLFVATAPMWFSLVKNVSRFIPAIPWIAVVIVTSRYSYSNVNFQYSVFLLPFVYLAAIPFLRSLLKRRKVIVALALVALSFTFLFSALSPTGPGWPATSSLAVQVDSINNSLPRNASILTESDLFPTKPPEYILVNFDSPWYNWTNPALGYPLSPREQTERFLIQYHYDLIVQDQGLHLYKLELTSPSSAPAPDPMG